jgi:predicted RNA-binding protein with TRAM domain
MHLQDFVECGAVCRCLRNNPDISNGEIARQTRLPVERVASLRSYLENELGSPRSVQSRQIREAHPASLRVVEVAVSEEREESSVKLNMEFTGRVSGVDEKGVGIVLIGGFKCLVPGSSVGELVKFRVKQIGIGDCQAELIRILQKSTSPQEAEVQTSIKLEEKEEEEEIKKACINCRSPINDEDFETYDGLCKQCYYNKLQNEATKTERRSGTFGTDRAGTW